MYHDQNILLGAGMVAAYELESSVAHVPRIVVTNEVAKMLPRYECKKRLRKDSDGFWLVHPFLCLLGGLDQRDIQECKKFRNAVTERAKKTREHIQKWLVEAKNDKLKLLEKYQWLANQFNAAIEEIFKDIHVNVDTIEVK